MDELLLADEIEKRYYDRRKELEEIKIGLRGRAHPDYIAKLKTEIKAYETAIDYAFL